MSRDELERILNGNPYYEEYDVPRESWQPIIRELFKALGIELWEGYQCELFEIHPYDYDADCDCGWDHHPFWQWFDSQQHTPECIATKYEQFQRIYGPTAPSRSVDYELYERKLAEWFKPIYESMGWDTKSVGWWHGISIRCSCDYWDRVRDKVAELENEGQAVGHSPSCSLIKPNFVYHPTDFRIWWYKYPLRGATCSQRIDTDEFARIVRDCIGYVKTHTGKE